MPKLRSLPSGLMLVALASVLLAFTACAPGTPPQVPVNASGVADPVLVDGRALYAEHCVSCHDRDGSGGVGARIHEGRLLAKYPEINVQTSLIANGIGGRMPAFSDKLEADEIEAVSRYAREVL